MKLHELKQQIDTFFESVSDEELLVMLNNDFIKSPFLKVNASAIPFPYIRSFVSNLTLQAGYAPVILPSVNFVALDGANSKTE